MFVNLSMIESRLNQEPSRLARSYKHDRNQRPVINPRQSFPNALRKRLSTKYILPFRNSATVPGGGVKPNRSINIFCGSLQELMITAAGSSPAGITGRIHATNLHLPMAIIMFYKVLVHPSYKHV